MTIFASDEKEILFQTANYYNVIRIRAFAFLLLSLVGQELFAQHTLRIVEYNVENLFDVRHDTLKNDLDFLPEGSYHWTPGRYWKKQNDVAKTLMAVGGEIGAPVLVGLCEVENDSVLFDLTHRSVLRSVGYDYVMTNSPDTRGVDVALLYQPFLFRLLDCRSVRVPSFENGFRPTRDILYAKGELYTSDTLHVVVCHLPSKAGGASTATRHRRLAVETLRSVVDSVMNIHADAKLLVMGDFNAAIGEKIFKRLMPPLHETLPTSRRARHQPRGTYYFQKQWSYLDHMLVSEGWLRWQGKEMEKTNDRCGDAARCQSSESCLPFLLNEKGVPNRMYRGPVYNGGVSDHLPLYIDVELSR